MSCAITGTLLVALCCFTPLLVIALITIGLGAFTPYLDYILFPALAVMVIVTYLSYRKYKSECASCDVISSNKQ
ncbi:MAG: mercury resistance system transport protein MerF [Candidatus Magasanikbacteria bacterium]|nr:mercury resistance system transport protein MerF [Candidatus Magasanikbacteria bacterium]